MVTELYRDQFTLSWGCKLVLVTLVNPQVHFHGILWDDVQRGTRSSRITAARHAAADALAGTAAAEAAGAADAPAGAGAARAGARGGRLLTVGGWGQLQLGAGVMMMMVMEMMVVVVVWTVWGALRTGGRGWRRGGRGGTGGGRGAGESGGRGWGWWWGWDKVGGAVVELLQSRGQGDLGVSHFGADLKTREREND